MMRSSNAYENNLKNAYEIKTKNYFNDCFGPCLGIVVHGVLRRARVIQRLYQ